MYNLFGEEAEIKTTKNPVDKARRNWEARFQRWSDKISQDGTTALGKCGYGAICEYCEDNSYGKPCVRALNEYLRQHDEKSIDYTKKDYENAFNLELKPVI